VKNWPVPTDLSSLQSFLGFMSYYRRFIHGFARIVTPLNLLQTTDVPFSWTPTCQTAFEHLRDALTCEPVVKLFDRDLHTRVESDSSGFAIRIVLTQKHRDGWHPVEFLSRSMTAPDKNYPIQEQELLAMIYVLKKWIHTIFGMKITAYTDHSSLTT